MATSLKKCAIFKHFKPWVEAVVPLVIWVLSRQKYLGVANLFLAYTEKDTFKTVISTLFLERGVIVLFGRVYISSIWKSHFNSYILKAQVDPCVTLSLHIIFIVQKPIFITSSFTFHVYRLFSVYVDEWF